MAAIVEAVGDIALGMIEATGEAEGAQQTLGMLDIFGEGVVDGIVDTVAEDAGEVLGEANPQEAFDPFEGMDEPTEYVKNRVGSFKPGWQTMLEQTASDLRGGYGMARDFYEGYDLAQGRLPFRVTPKRVNNAYTAYQGYRHRDDYFQTLTGHSWQDFKDTLEEHGAEPAPNPQDAADHKVEPTKMSGYETDAWETPQRGPANKYRRPNTQSRSPTHGRYRGRSRTNSSMSRSSSSRSRSVPRVQRQVHFHPSGAVTWSYKQSESAYPYRKSDSLYYKRPSGKKYYKRTSATPYYKRHPVDYPKVRIHTPFNKSYNKMH